MKKRNYFLALAISVAFFSCDKDEIKNLTQNNSVVIEQKQDNLAIPFEVDAKDQNGPYNLFTNIGHLGTNCPGCVTVNGKIRHVDCQGAGSTCLAQASVSLSLQQNDMYQAVTLYEYDLTTENFFLMPDRSLFVEMDGKEEVWLNVPEQLAIRDSMTGMFTFNNLFFSNYQVHKNQ